MKKHYVSIVLMLGRGSVTVIELLTRVEEKKHEALYTSK